MADRIHDFAAERALRDRVARLGDGGGGAGGQDAWQQSVEERIRRLDDKIDKTMLWVLGAFAAGFIVLGGLVLNRTDALSAKIEASNDRLSGQITELRVTYAERPKASAPTSPPTVQPAS